MATIDGTSASETLAGGSDPDLINGEGGNDTITGNGGNDTLNGGSGDDIFVIGGNSFGYDIYDGDDGADKIYLNANVSVSQFLLTSANVIDTETLDMGGRILSGTGGNDVFNISGIQNVVSYRVIDLLDGNDAFLGYQGADRVDGGTGNDTLNGGAGDDELTGGGGYDSLFGGSGNDTFDIGGNDIGLDRFFGGDGADVIRMTGNISVSQLLLSATNVVGTETLDMSGRILSGTGGNDVFNISGLQNVSSYRVIDLADGNDNFTGYQGTDYVNGGAGNDTLNGGAGDDKLTGGTGNDMFNGGTGNDTFYIGGNDFGTDRYLGGTGADVIEMTSNINVSSFMLTATAVYGTETLNMSGRVLGGTGSSDIFNLSGLTYVTSYRQIALADGNDNFTGYRGDDNVAGDSGNDTLSGGAGNDRLTGGTGNDVLNGGTGDDTFYIGGSDFGSDRYYGGTGSDTIYMTGDIYISNFLMTAAIVAGTESLNMGGRRLGGTGGSDIFNLSGLSSVSSYRRIDLADGNDSFTGHRGNDYVDGGAGNDTLIGGAGNDTLWGGTGIDTLSYTMATGGIQVNLALTGAQNLGGGQGVDILDAFERVLGSNYSDRITGNASANLLVGNNGNDILEGAGGNDTLTGGSGVDTAVYTGASSGVTVSLSVAGAQNVGGGVGIDLLSGIENLTGSAYGDRLTGNAGANLLSAAGGNDLLTGADGNDTLYGDTGNDTLYGGAGSDVLWGQTGDDQMFGGAGADQFAFQAGYGADRINDWENGTDHILIRGGATYNDFSDLTVTSVSGNAVVSFGGTTITLVGIGVSQIDASDFQFV